MQRRHVFYHADRSASLREGQEIVLDKCNLSRFGSLYWPIFQTTPLEKMSREQQREFHLEQIKQQPRYHLYTSRLQSMFAANSIAEAVVFAMEIVPKPTHPIPIIEIFAEKFWTLDSNWLDYEDPTTESYYNYWDGRISNNCPQIGERRPPRLEVVIALPAMAGKVVHVVE